MSSMILNLDLGGSHSQSKAGNDHSNQNHKKFLRKRRFLEKKGFLKPKQTPHPAHHQPPGKPCQSHFNQRFSDFKQRNLASTPSLPEKNHERNTNLFRNDGFSHLVPSQKIFPNVNHASRSDYTGPQKGSLIVTVGSNHGDSRSATFAPNGKKTGSLCSVNQSILPKNYSGRDKSGSRSGTCKIDLTNEYESGLAPITVSNFPHKLVAIDCEMVGTGPGGRRSDLARCTVVSYHGDVVYDKYVQPPNPITDFRTRWSGIRKHHMKNATPFKAAQKEILKILGGKVVVGHAIHNDFKALNYFHPKSLTRDTSKSPLLNRKGGFNEMEAVSLKRLTKQLLSRDIQVGKDGHSSVEDAKATMELYRIVEAEWERELACNPVQVESWGANRKLYN